MRRPAGRPIGLTLIVALLALNGIASLVQAFELTRSATSPAEPILSAVIGLALLQRARAVWRFQRVGYLVTLVLLSVRAVLAALDLIFVASTAVAWINLILVLTILLCLLQAEVRSLFFGGEHGSQGQR